MMSSGNADRGLMSGGTGVSESLDAKPSNYREFLAKFGEGSSKIAGKLETITHQYETFRHSQ